MCSLRGNKNIRENKDPTRPESPLGDKLTEGDMIAKTFPVHPADAPQASAISRAPRALAHTHKPPVQ